MYVLWGLTVSVQSVTRDHRKDNTLFTEYRILFSLIKRNFSGFGPRFFEDTGIAWFLWVLRVLPGYCAMKNKTYRTAAGYAIMSTGAAVRGRKSGTCPDSSLFSRAKPTVLRLRLHCFSPGKAEPAPGHRISVHRI